MNFLKREEKKPYTYSSIEMRKSSKGYIWWIGGIVLVALIFFLLLLK